MKKKKEIIEILKGLRFLVEYDQWDVKNKEWIRFRHEKDIQQRQEFALIAYKVQKQDTILYNAAEILLKIGQWQKIQQLNEFI